MLPTLNQVTPANWMLAALPSNDLQRLAATVRPVLLPKSKVLHTEESPIEHVYFLEQGLASLVLSTQQGQSVEVGLVGCEGIVGTCGVMGSGHALHQSIIQMEAPGWCMPIESFKEEFRHNNILHDLILHHLELLHLQASQTALCNRLHPLEARLCRWLLLARYYSQAEALDFTQESIAHMLGVRRAGITMAARILQREGIIYYQRGSIEILDHAALARAACPCYEVIRRHFNQLYAHSRDVHQKSKEINSKDSLDHLYLMDQNPKPCPQQHHHHEPLTLTIGVEELIAISPPPSTSEPPSHHLAATSDTACIYHAPPHDGTKTRAGLGLKLAPMTRELADRYRMQVMRGNVITKVEAHSPAARAGLQPGDIIERVGPRPVSTPQEAQIEVKRILNGQTGDKKSISLHINRRGEKKLVALRVTNRLSAS